MAGQLLLLNPSKRRKKRAAPKKRAAKRRTARRRNPITIAAPARRRRRAPARRRAVARRRRNPINIRGLGGSSLIETLKNAMFGGVGAIGVDMLYGQLQKFWAGAPVKVSATGGPNPMYYAVKAGIALAVPLLAGKVIGKSLASKLAAGSLTVQAYEVAKAVIPVSASLPLGMYAPARNAGMGAYVGPGSAKLRGYLNHYIPPSSNGQFAGSFSRTGARGVPGRS